MTKQGATSSPAFDFEAFADDNDLDAELKAASEGSLFDGISVAVVDQDPDVRDYVSELLEGRVDTARSLVEIETRLGFLPIVIVMGPSCVRAADFELVNRWSRSKPNVGAILISSEVNTRILKTAMKAGVKDVLAAPIARAQLVEAITEVSDLLSIHSGERPTPPETNSRVGLRLPEPVEEGRVISIFSTKGGSGKSVTATNIGVVMAQQSKRPVVLIDAHLQFGDVAVMMKIKPIHTVVDAVSALETADSQVIRELMTKHEESGLLVLPAPLEPTFADQVTGEQIVRLVELVKEFAGHVIIDLPAIFNEVVLNVLEMSDDIVLVTGFDIPNIKNAKIGLSTLSLLGIPENKIHLVINRSDSKVKLDLAEVRRSLRIDAVGHIPSNVIVPISVNRGIPVTLSASKSGVARSFEQLALRFLDKKRSQSDPQPSRRRFFS